jgi:hypothetical protein
VPRPARRIERAAAGISRANANRSLEIIARLKNLLSQIERQGRTTREKRVDCL